MGDDVAVQRRRLLPVLAVVLLASASIVLSGCSNFFTGTTQLTASYDATASTSSAYSVNVTASSGKGMGMGFCISSINYQWSDEATEHQGWASAGLPQCLMSVQRVLKIPTRAGGGTLRVHAVAFDSVPLWPDRDDTWSAPIVIPAAAAAASGSTTTTPLAAVLFARQSPAGTDAAHVAAGTVLDARQSTGTGTLAYAWSTGCNDTSGLTTGLARVPSGFSGTCTVTVTDSTGASTSASSTIASASLQNGYISFPSGTSAAIYAPVRTGWWVDHACIDFSGGSRYSKYADVSTPDNGAGGTGGPYGTVQLTALTPGLHRISVVLFTGSVYTDQDCAALTNPTADPEYRQTLTALYSVATDGSVSARRGGRATTAFIAPSSLRFVSTKTITEGTVDKLGAIGGATASGTFSWATPKASKGIKRPAGAGDLAKGTYVMRSISMSPGTKTGASTLLLGTGTVLLRGVSGTLACGTISGTFGSSTLTLAGGTGTARTLAGVVTGKPMGYVFPKSPKKPTKKPSNKSKPVKVKPVKAAGTATLQTSAKATALPSACQALVQYLPQ